MPKFTHAQSLDEHYAFLDDCPAHVFAEVVTMPIGTLQERVAGVSSWNDALLRGELPTDDVWPPPEIAGPIRKALTELDIARFCRDQADLRDAVLKDVVAGFSRQAGNFADEIVRRLRELEGLERRRLDDLAGAEKRTARKVGLDDATASRLRAEAERLARACHPKSDAGIIAQWQKRARAWAEISDVFGDLGALLGRGWDMAPGVLREAGWMDIVRLRELVKRLPQLAEIVRQLGRLQMSVDGESVTEKVMVPMLRVQEERRLVRTPLAPTEARGVERSGEIGRMLPAEAVFLGHPKLRLLWHARRAEQALLTYQYKGLVTERTLVEREGIEEIEQPRPRPVRGPILVIVDTSGSMHGAPELVAKALVLEAMRTAHAERRRCFLYAYSGHGQIEEHELSVSGDGLGRLLSFLGMTFGGGNDEVGVLRRALARLNADDWRKADVLFASDGEWPAPGSVVAEVKAAGKNGTRFHGVQIGNRGTTGLHAICDPVHKFADWLKLGGL